MFSKSTVSRVNRVIEIARALKPAKQTGRSFHCTAVYDKGKLVTVGYNDYTRAHPKHKYGEYKPCKFPTNNYKPCLHSEASALIRGGIENGEDYTFINVRINNDNSVGMAKPCPNCFKLIQSIGFKKLIYTDLKGEINEM